MSSFDRSSSQIARSASTVALASRLGGSVPTHFRYTPCIVMSSSTGDSNPRSPGYGGARCNWRRAMRPMPPSRSSWPLALLEGFHSRCCDACSKRYLGPGPLADQIACHKRKVTPGVIPFGGTLSRPLPPRFARTLRWRKTDSNHRSRSPDTPVSFEEG